MHHDRTDDEIERIASELSDSAGLNFILPAFWLHVLLEKLHKTLVNFEIKKVSELELPVAEAFADCNHNKISIKKNVYQAALQGFGRERMTLAHEIGHLVLKHTGNRYRRPGEILSSQEKQEEWETKRFAVHLLMPRNLATACRTAREIEKKFLVSQEAAEYRFDEINKINRLVTGTPRPLPPNVQDYLAKRLGDDHLSNVGSPQTSFPIAPIFGPNIYPVQRGLVFVVMPLNNGADRRYREIIRPAIDFDSGMTARRGDDAYSVGDIRADIWKSICECRLVIADVTGFNANVVYELGIAHAAGKETIILHEHRDEDEKFPIDFAAYRRINYTNDAPGGQELRRKLGTMLKSFR